MVNDMYFRLFVKKRDKNEIPFIGHFGNELWSNLFDEFYEVKNEIALA